MSDETKNLTGKMELFLNEMRSLEEAIAREKEITSAQRGQMKEMQSRYETMLSHGSQQIQALKIEKEKLEKLLVAHQGQIKNLETRCGAAIEENKVLKGQIQKLQASIEGLERANKLLSDQNARISGLEKKIEQAGVEQASLMRSTQEEQIRRKAIEQEASELRARLNETNRELNAARDENAKLDQASREQTLALSQELEATRSRAEDLQKELLSNAQTIQARTSELREAQLRIREYSDRVEMIQANYQAFQGSVSELALTVESSITERNRQQSLENIEIVRQVLKAEVDRKISERETELESKLIEARREADCMNVENKNLREAGIANQSRVLELEGRISVMKERESSLLSEIRRLRAVYPLRDLLASKDYEINRLQQDVSKLDPNQPEREKLEMILRSIVAQRDQIQSVVAESERRALQASELEAASIQASEKAKQRDRHPAAPPLGSERGPAGHA